MIAAMPLSRLVAACLVLAAPVFAQPFGQNSRGATLTHIQLNSADPDAAIAFWTDVIGMGGSSRGPVKGASTRGVLLLFTQKAPSGPSAGSAIDHIALRVPDLPTFAATLAKTQYKTFTPPGTHDALMLDGPDGVRIEVIEDNTLYAPLEFSHIHFHSKAPRETQAWYGKFFGARTAQGGPADTSQLMGSSLIFTSADNVEPTAGRAIDHLTFEVRDLKSFSDTLAASGVKLDPGKDGSIFLTDPWGTRIELTASSGK